MKIISILQIIVALGLINVWLLRYSKETAYRGRSAKNLKEEFAVYGLPEWFHYLIGVLKVIAALALIIGLWKQQVAYVAALVVSVLMLGALAMHFKVQDSAKKFIPATLMLLMGLVIVYGHSVN